MQYSDGSFLCTLRFIDYFGEWLPSKRPDNNTTDRNSRHCGRIELFRDKNYEDIESQGISPRTSSKTQTAVFLTKLDLIFYRCDIHIYNFEIYLRQNGQHNFVEFLRILEILNGYCLLGIPAVKLKTLPNILFEEGEFIFELWLGVVDNENPRS